MRQDPVTPRGAPADLVVAGGGAAGFFAAVTAAEHADKRRVLLLEKSPELLAKVAISGGGRCNVTHACFDPRRLTEGYPRGGRELLGALHRWQVRDTVDWFESRGVPLKTEPDGRIFPVSDQAASITGCLEGEARRLGVETRRGCGVRAVRRADQGFDLQLSDGTTARTRCLLLATGGNTASSGYGLAESLGHTLEPPVPSLFAFDVQDERIRDLAGVSVSRVAVSTAGLRQEGPLLITHRGLSGPAILRLSAWGARALHALEYRFDLHVDWLPALSAAELKEDLSSLRVHEGAARPGSHARFELPLRLWRSLLQHAGVSEDTRWSTLSSRLEESILRTLKQTSFAVTGRSLNKEEFVTCGGVRLSEVDFRTMESRVCPGLFLAGEVLDIDGITGGFNLQAAWTTGRIAGESIARALDS